MTITVQRAAHKLLASLPSAFRTKRPAVEPVSMTKAPRTWTFTDTATGERKTFTCMPGCIDSHDEVRDGETLAEDIWCYRQSSDVTLPINDSGRPEELSVLRAMMNVDPFDRRIAHRLPHIDLEVMDGAWIEGLDPDGFATVISTLQGRVDELRAMHAELVAVRAAYQGQVAR
ncbi:DUF6907 domain-containing protein [Streptomyces showdoensis]|uniref:Uncharacterized protein n=1 Tax=Streptomyces showdoensis TaxID=68268 RepID=A0A2P2GS55_STREW|nr:hypothetical protein [Streptomyces showdoensis]KKZ74331.1 hypothetical protein VO63_07745 [Streptomyces showdoensis]